MTAEQFYEGLESRLAKFGQQHLLAHWDQLSAPQRKDLAEQIAAIDFDLIGSLFRGEADQPDWDELSRRAEPPRAMRLADRLEGRSAGLGISPEQARQAGVEALNAGKIGVILVAGGQGSRLGFEEPKSVFPIGPVSGKTLLEIHAEKVRAAARRCGTAIPLYLMTSPATHQDTVEFLRASNNVGMTGDDLLVFCQGTMPAVDAKTGHVLMSAPDSLFLSPDGHGGTVAALAKSGALDHMRLRGIESLFYLQVDNPLTPICDAELIGYHLLAESQLTSLAVTKHAPDDKLGNFVTVDGRMQVIEYSDFPLDVGERRDADGELVFWAGSVAIHVFDRQFLEQAATDASALPFHVAHKKVPHIDAQGAAVQPTENNALKFERFIFDLLPQATNPIVIEYAEEDVFAPLKNAPGAPRDTPEYVRQLMHNQHRRWLEAAGAEVDADAKVEISPLFGLDAEGVAQQVDASTRLAGEVYLEGDQ